mmetsp:Transcript_114966/g.324914  ORF Transcript_114966/g.324914 Transcript_114966/m.324914 type:complete len:90 (-) Transcript_114966:1376-1645(-)
MTPTRRVPIQQHATLLANNKTDNMTRTILHSRRGADEDKEGDGETSRGSTAKACVVDTAISTPGKGVAKALGLYRTESGSFALLFDLNS